MWRKAGSVPLKPLRVFRPDPTTSSLHAMHKNLTAALAFGLVCCVVVCSYAVVQIVDARSDALQVQRRLQRVEALLNKREEADPLLAKECAGWSGPGATKDAPCFTQIYRLDAVAAAVSWPLGDRLG